ncbi:energy transducer TonB [Pollutibacter soli]|uniref:energy transducer TonB n=1 Tax=Pollutibacter soli TaxID=3034157 RepID=UPI0030135F56
MRQILIIYFLSILVYFPHEVIAQTDSSEMNFLPCCMETPVGYPGGIKNFKKFIHKNIRPVAYSRNKTFRVLLKINVDSSGTVNEVTVVNSASDEIDYEAIRLIRSSGSWISATACLKKVSQTIRLPLVFTSRRFRLFLKL